MIGIISNKTELTLLSISYILQRGYRLEMRLLEKYTVLPFMKNPKHIKQIFLNIDEEGFVR